MPEYIPPVRGFPEQWRFDQSRPLDAGTFPLSVAVGAGGVITSRLVRVQIHYTAGSGLRLKEQGKYTGGDGSLYYTARVSLRQMRDDLLKPRPRPLARLLESWSGLGGRAIATVLDVSLANS